MKDHRRLVDGDCLLFQWKTLAFSCQFFFRDERHVYIMMKYFSPLSSRDSHFNSIPTLSFFASSEKSNDRTVKIVENHKRALLPLSSIKVNNLQEKHVMKSIIESHRNA